MPVTFHNFLYDAARDGYDTSSWRTIYGSPVLLGGALKISETAVVRRSDIWRGDLTMNLTIPSDPTGGETRRFGFYSPTSGAYAWFAIGTEAFYGQISDGGSNSSSTAITWSDGVIESSWDATGTDYRIVWEAGQVHFYVAGSKRLTLSGEGVPRDPMAIYISNSNSDTMLLNYINAKGLQTLFVHTDESDTTTDSTPLLISQAVAITESTTLDLTKLQTGGPDAVTISESQTLDLTMLQTPTAEAVSITESVSQTQVFDAPAASTLDNVSIAENVATLWTHSNPDVSEAVSIGESVAIVAT